MAVTFTVTTDEYAGYSIDHYNDRPQSHYKCNCQFCGALIVRHNLADMRTGFVRHLTEDCDVFNVEEV